MSETARHLDQVAKKLIKELPDKIDELVKKSDELSLDHPRTRALANSVRVDLMDVYLSIKKTRPDITLQQPDVGIYAHILMSIDCVVGLLGTRRPIVIRRKELSEFDALSRLRKNAEAIRAYEPAKPLKFSIDQQRFAFEENYKSQHPDARPKEIRAAYVKVFPGDKTVDAKAFQRARYRCGKSKTTTRKHGVD
jgi:hypothetical protein